ncbi:MAG: methyltransferase [Lacisediminihabitans sp.]
MTTATAHNVIKTWVASGPAGAVGSVHQTGDGYTFRLLSDEGYRGNYPTLEVAKSALHASLLPGSEWPEFSEH